MITNSIDQEIVVGLVYLACDTLNKLFTKPPSEICPDMKFILDSIGNINCLHNWCAKPTDIFDTFCVEINRIKRYVVSIDIGVITPELLCMNYAPCSMFIISTITHNGYVVCSKLYYPLDEQNCHEGWCKKLYTAFIAFSIAKASLPAH